MKTVHFQNNQFLVPSWANYITQDIDGYCVWEDMPMFDYEENCYVLETPFRMWAVFPVNGGVHAIMKIED